MDEYKKQKEKSQEKFEELIKTQNKKKEELAKEAASQVSSLKDQIVMGVVLFIWIGLVVYANYIEIFSSKKSARK